ncbi:MAG: alanine--tRNA ligase [Bacilli bacterium]|nr:alanine--tRNA ligase [Bacilli bacterium]
MKMLKSYEIRQMWLDFWRSKGHDIIDSAPLIPNNDPTLLWINAGVAPLKKYFDGSEIPQNRRMANAQKSIRTNDIDNVGRTARHHTFFEMLGNFSIGDYFREDALTFAMEVLTSPKWYHFDLEKLYFTVYPNDTDTINKWIELGVDPSHIIKVEDNFWEIGEGPCGPDTEIFFDRGIQYDPENIGIRMIEEDLKNDRYIEIWNIVFSQFNAKTGLKRSQYKELPSKNIDTGMGLERMACVIQGTPTNYETDLFYPIIDTCSKMVGVPYQGQMAFKVIADHVRSVVFALSDGAMFSNEGRGYVLRRLLRRAVRYGKILGMEKAFLHELVSVVVDIMKGFYPYLLDKQALVTKQIQIEEEKFLNTLESGEKRLLDFIKNASSCEINKETAFLLYDTFGFPFELTQEVASEHDFVVDEAGFLELLNLQKERARLARGNTQSMNTQNEAMMKFTKPTSFIGYDALNGEGRVIALFKDGFSAQSGSGELIAVFDKTPFYAESGGQIGDIGTCTMANRNYVVSNTIKLPNGQHASMVDFREDTLKVDDVVLLSVDEDTRQATARNHSATHLLNEALRTIVGEHVIQQGSFVGNQFFRFDFNNFAPLTNTQILEVEQLVNQIIREKHPVIVLNLPIEEAKKLNAQAVFGEKYGAIVRVVDMEFSKEFCGGTHVSNTGDIGKMAIVSIETKGSGIYRIEGTTHDQISTELHRSLENIEHDIVAIRERIDTMEQEAKAIGIVVAPRVAVAGHEVESYEFVLSKREELENLRTTAKELEKEINRKKIEQSTLDITPYLSKVEVIQGIPTLIFRLNGVASEVAKEAIDRLSNQLPNGVILCGLVQEDKIVFICKNKVASLHAGNLVKIAAQAAGGNGGGRNDFAQAGAKDVQKIDVSLAKAREAVKGAL